MQFFGAVAAACIFVVLSVVILVFPTRRSSSNCDNIKLKFKDMFQGQSNEGGVPLNTARYKKTIYSIVWVQFVLIACCMSCQKWSDVDRHILLT